MYLICDFDRTLFKNDFFQEQFFKLLLEKPWLVANELFKQGGLLKLKKKLLGYYSPSYPLDFLLNREVVQEIANIRHQYKRVVLISASPQEFVERVVQPLGIFDEIHGSQTTNLKSKKKLQFIKEKGFTPFVYFGDSKVDTCIFKASHSYYYINGKSRFKLITNE